MSSGVLSHIDDRDAYQNKGTSEKKSEHSIVSRIHQLVSGEPVKWSAVPPPLSKSDMCFDHNVAKIFLVSKLGEWSFLLLVAISWSVLSVLQSRGRRCNLVVDMVFVAKSWSVRFLLAKSWLAWICKRPHSQLPKPTHFSSCFCSCSCSY